MLEQYRELLERLRRDQGSWSELDFVSVPHPKWARVDRNYASRYGVLVCLQYDRRDDDHDLICSLFEQEVLAREGDPFQGETRALQVGAFLLARFLRPGDLPLFWRAKKANFDTWCGFNAEYLLLADRSAGSDFIGSQPEGLRDMLSEMLGKAPDSVDHVHLEHWWQKKQTEFPDREEDESPLELARRAIALGALQEGRYWLDRWEHTQSGDAETLRTLMHLRDALDQPAAALAAAEQKRYSQRAARERARIHRELGGG